MIVAPHGLVAGTIGGGALEHEAIEKAKTLKMSGVEQRALGPDLGQCCGGAVTLVYDLYNEMPETKAGVILRPIGQSPARNSTPPLSVQRIQAKARNGDWHHGAELSEGWLIEGIENRNAPVWIWGAGHVGRAIVSTASALPEIDLTWIDTGPERFPENVPKAVTTLPVQHPERLVSHAPLEAHHLILTYSHALDLMLCDALLRHKFAFAGLIGSCSKWARFRNRLAALGHSNACINGITCPIGDPSLGKHPQQIAVGVIAALLRNLAHQDAIRDKIA